MYKRIFSMSLGLIFTIMALVGCGTSKASKPIDQSSPPQADAWSYIKDKEELIVGLDDTFAPMGFRDAKGELVGFDIDLAKAVGEELGVGIRFQPISWDAKEMELSSKRIDCIWNGMSATADRMENMALTNKYLNNKIIIMTNERVSVSSKGDLAKLKIGIQAKSAALEVIAQDPDYDTFKAQVKEYPTYDEVILDMQAGRLDCMIVDQVLGEYKNSKLENKLGVSEIDFGDDYYAIGCRKGEEVLAEKINTAIQALIDSGKAGELSKAWFGKDIVIFEDYK